MSTRVRGYVIEGHVARGGMGDVHRARVEATGEEVALKVMRAASTFDDEAATRERFVREARVLAGLSHPCIVRYVAHGTTLDGQPYVAAEWIEGETLADRIARKRVSPRDAAALGASLADALATSHEAGVVHRDLKPTNVMIAKDGRPKLIDFGVAKSASPALTLDGAIVGSHGYMSPEQLRGGLAVGPAADVYGLGCVLFRALTGRTPFEGSNEGERLARMLLEDAPDVREARPDVPEELAKLIASMLRAEAEERPGARALAKELALIARVMESVAPPAMREDALSRKEQSLVSVVYVAAASPDAPTNAPETAAPMLDDVRGILAERGARIEKLPNGALAAVFGPRAALGEQLHAAAAAALEAWRIAPEHPIALTTGRAEITGRSAFGDAIGRAVELGRVAAATIALDEASASLLASRFVVAPSKRSTAERRVYSLVAQRSAPEAARTVRGRVVPLFGRDAELAALLEAWRACVADNRGAAALVVGGAGAGKTRLAAEVVARIRGGLPRAPMRSYSDALPISTQAPPTTARAPAPAHPDARAHADATAGADAHVVVARADPLGSGAPYALARAIAASVVDADLPPPSSRAPPSNQAPLGPFIAHLLGRADAYADDEGLRAARVDPALMRDRLREAFASVVGKAFASRPLLFLIEDLQWADAASVRLLAEIAARATRPLLVVALARPEIEDGAPPFGAGALALRLGALSDDAAASLARAVAGDSASPQAIERIVRLGDGNAFFVEELARVAAGGTETLPESVVAVTQARLGALPPYARQVLRAASLLRPWIARDALVDLLGTSAQTGDLDATLDELVAREILVRAEGGIVFRHELLAEAAYASLTEEDARRGHLATAALLVARGASDPRLVAEHLERGGDRAGAAKAFARAAKAALDGDDAKAALASAERATALGADGAALGLALAVRTAVERWRGDLRRAVAFGTEALGLLDRASATWLETATDVAAAAGSAGDTTALERVASLMLDHEARAGASAWAVRAFAAAAVSLVRTGDVARADPLLARAEAMRTELAADQAIADIGLLNARAARRNFTGDPLAYLETMPSVVEHATHLRDGRTACLARAHLGYGWAAVGAWKEAGETLRAALEEATRLKLAAARTSALHNLALVLEAEGDRDGSARMQTEALEASIDQRATRLATACRLDLALVLLRADRAREALEHAKLGAESAVEAPLRASADAVVALAHAALGEGREALVRAEAAKDAYTRMGGIGEHEPLVHLAWARALALTGGDAAGAARAALARLRARAQTIADLRIRESFLGAVPVNVDTLRFVEETGGE